MKKKPAPKKPVKKPKSLPKQKKVLLPKAVQFTQVKKPNDAVLVMELVMRVSGIELLREQSVYLNPVKGMIGPVRVTGNSLPAFDFKMFEKSIMEFIHVRVEVAMPERIEFICTIDSTTAPERHGEVVPATQEYKDAFFQLAYSLFNYWPIYRNAAIDWSIREKAAA